MGFATMTAEHSNRARECRCVELVIEDGGGSGRLGVIRAPLPLRCYAVDTRAVVRRRCRSPMSMAAVLYPESITQGTPADGVVQWPARYRPGTGVRWYGRPRDSSSGLKDQPANAP